MTFAPDSPISEPTMFEILANIRNIGAGLEDPYTSEYIHAAIERSEAFEEVLLRDYPVLGYCGCGSPSLTLEALLKAMKYCTISTEYGDTEREEYLQEHFGIVHVSNDGLVQFLFYSLVTMGLLRHNYSLNAATLTNEGEIFYQLLDEYVEAGDGLMQ